MFIQHHGVLQQKQPIITGSTNLIETDKTYITADWIRLAYSDYCAINVTPDTMSTTITKIDTGDGTSWATVSPSSGTGDYSFRARTSSANTGSTIRHMTLRISDNAGLAASVDVTLNQSPEMIS